MGGFYLKLIPLDPNFVPEEKTLSKLAKVLPTLRGWAREVKIKIEEHPVFIDQGQMLKKICCPCCKQELDTEWWGKVMDKSFLQSNFLNLQVKVPCCGSMVSLNDLVYDFPGGFARFAISLFEPGLMGDSAEAVGWLEEKLGFKLKQVRAKY